MTRKEIEKLPFNIDMLLSESLLVDTKEQVHKKITEVCSLAIKALEQELRDCKTCIHSDKGKCAGTEECHECMWESKYEQEPCEDCISRQATVERLCKVAEFMNEKRNGLGSPYVMAALFIQDNKDEFPPVTPKPKTGHWINKYHEVFKYYCDKYGTGSDLRTPYCPNCGAKMESEDKE